MNSSDSKTDWPAIALAVVASVLYAAVIIADIFFALGWLLRLLEINSVFNRWLSQWSALELFEAVIATGICTGFLIKIFGWIPKHGRLVVPSERAENE